MHCYKCGDEGHIAQACTKPFKRPAARLEQEDEVVEVKVAKKEEFNYDSVDFSKFGKKGGEVEEGEEKRRKGQEKSGGGRQKQRFMKRGSKSSTFKR